MFSVTTSVGFWLCAFLALLAAGMAAIFGRNKLIATPPGNGLLALLAWFLAFVATFAVLGFVPSFATKWNVQHPAVVMGAAAGIVVPITAFFWFIARYVLRQGRLPPWQRSWLYHVGRLFLAISAGLASVAPLMIAVDRRVRSVVLRDLNEFPNNIVSWLRPDEFRSSRGSWPNAIEQWGLNSGLFWSAAIWLAILTFVFWRKINRFSETGGTEHPLSRWWPRLPNWSRYIGKSAAAVAAILFLLSIASATQWTVCLQAQYDRQRARLANPHWLADEVMAKAKELELQQESSAEPSNAAAESAEEPTP